MNRNPELDTKMVDLYRQGLNSTQIAQAVGRSQSGVWRSLNRLGVWEVQNSGARDRVQRYMTLHDSGLSTKQIAAVEGVKKNSVIWSLRKYGKLRRALGRDVELEVASWTSAFAKSCYRMKGDRPFDMLVDGKRIDVKSASACGGRYYFSINHKGSNRTHKDKVDDFYLVFKNANGRPVYRLPATDVHVSRSLSIPMDIVSSKYKLSLLGHLDVQRSQEVMKT